MYQLFNFNGPIAWVVWPTAIISFLYWKILQWDRRGMQAIAAGLATANQAHGTSFPTGKKPKGALMMGEYGAANSYCLIFDTAKRKVAVTAHNFCSVHDFDYLAEWQLHWNEKSIGSTLIQENPYLLVGTTDLQRPTLKVRAGTVAQGRDWDRQLSILTSNKDAE